MVGRISSLQRFFDNRDQVTLGQVVFAENSSKLNTGQRYLENYDAPDGGKELIQLTGRVAHATERASNQRTAITELELAESALINMKNILDQIKDDALQGGSDSASQLDLEILGVQLRNLGENIYQLANLKVGNKYIFGGLQSDLKVVTHAPGAIFENATYKESQADLGERVVEDLQSSISLRDFFTTTAAPAVYTSPAAVTPLAANSELNLIVNDGTQDIVVGDIALAVGDNLATIVTKINTAYTNAGGQGAIAQANAGFLEFNTSLMTGNVDNEAASIVIGPGTGLPATLANIGGLQTVAVSGTSTNIRKVLGDLDSAYNSNDSTAVRNIIVDLEANLTRLNNAQAKLGDLVSKFTDTVERSIENKEALQLDQADVANISVAEAVQEVSASQATLNATLRASATIISQNIFDFLNL